MNGFARNQRILRRHRHALINLGDHAARGRQHGRHEIGHHTDAEISGTGMRAHTEQENVHRQVARSDQARNRRHMRRHDVQNTRGCQTAIGACAIQSLEAKVVGMFGQKSVADLHADKELRTRQRMTLGDQALSQPEWFARTLRPRNDIALRQDGRKIKRGALQGRTHAPALRKTRRGRGGLEGRGDEADEPGCGENMRHASNGRGIRSNHLDDLTKPPAVA